MKKYYLLPILLCWFLQSKAQWLTNFRIDIANNPSPAVNYTPLKTIQLTNSDLIFLYRDNNYELYLASLSKSDGTLKWHLDFLQNADTLPADIIATSDNAFILTSINRSVANGYTTTNFEVRKFAASSELVWETKYPNGNARQAIQTLNGNIGVIGSYYDSAQQMNKGTLQLLDGSTGTILQTKTFAGYNFMSIDTNASGYLCYADNGSANGLLGIYMLDATGSIVWRCNYPFSLYRNLPCNIISTPGGCIFNRGDSLALIDKNGVITTIKKGIPGGISRLKNNGYLLGTWFIHINPSKIGLTGYTAMGDTLWTKTYPNNNTTASGTYGIQATDSSFVVCGSLYNTVVFNTNDTGYLTNVVPDTVSFFPSYSTLNSNNVRVSFLSDGSILTSPYSNPSSFIVPVADSGGISPVFNMAPTIGAKDENNNIHVASQHYSQDCDYWAGPVKNLSPYTVNAWDKVWNVKLTDIRDHILDFLDNQQIDDPIPSIFDWPGKQNKYTTGRNGVVLDVDEDMAPFVDLNHNGIYEPNLGEYPDIKGDQMEWFVFNDAYAKHIESNGTPLNVQIAGSAYEYNCPDSNLFNTVFTAFKITNKSGINYHDFYYGQWVDFDLGCFSNDRIGCDTLCNSFYVYNGTTPDPDCQIERGYGTRAPIESATFLNRKLTSHLFYTNGSLGQSDPNAYPNSIYYSLLGLNTDSTPIIIVNNGDTTTTKYVFPGNPADPTGWSECSVASTLQAGDRRDIGSTGPYNLDKDSTLDFLVAYTYHGYYPDHTLCPNITSMRAHILDLQNTYQLAKGCDVTLPAIPDSLVLYNAVNTLADKPSVSIYPNPATNELIIDAINFTPTQVSVYDIAGKMIILQSYAHRLNISTLTVGVYLLEIKDGDNVVRKKFIKIQAP